MKRCLSTHMARMVPFCRHPTLLPYGTGKPRLQHTVKGAQRHVTEVPPNRGAGSVRPAVPTTARNYREPTVTDPGREATWENDNGTGGIKHPMRLCKPGRERHVAYWLLGSAGITAGVMAVGAYVRLNESGLSMLDWHLLGRHLPKDEDEWTWEFERYKTTPEYKEVHYNIEMDEYKRIYLNEWVHRMLGRLSGICFGGGALYLAVRGALAPGGYLLTLAGVSLGLSQAFVGKWMVESGFKEPETEYKMPRVSPYRLSMHFTNALAIYSICLWNGLKLLNQTKTSVDLGSLRKVRCLGRATLASLFMTMLYGTIVAGNDAGLAYNTWPKMLDSYIPDDYSQVNTLRHLFEKTGVVQFNHRCLGYITATLAGLTYWSARKPGIPAAVRKLAMGTLHASVLQVLIGILTVLKQVPLHGAMTHHVNAIATWSVLLALLLRLR